MLKSRSRSKQGTTHAKPVALTVSVHATEKAEAIAAVKRHTKSIEIVALGSSMASRVVSEPALESVDPGYR